MGALFPFLPLPWRLAWTMNWRALVDIALMTFLVYQVSIRFRGTQAARIGAGLAILGVLYVLAQSMGLLLTTWVLGGLWAAALILVIVLFQAEIRQVLVQVNRATPSLRQVFRRARRLTDIADVLATIAATCFALGEKRCGALLVFERRDPLEPLLRNQGVVVDARVSPQLLETVFTPPTPLHDGALYLRAGRVYRAGCILPLSETSSLPSCYGTRHRAAVGITERSDALAVVVSEERGEITVVEWGEMVTLTGPLKLRAWLTPRLSNPPAARTSGWAGSLGLSHNWQAKLGALAVVSLLWLVVVGPQNTEVGFTIPVVYHNIPEDLDLVGQHTQEVYLGVRGSRELLRFLNQERLRAEIDLKEAREGTTRYSLSAHEVNLPLGLQVAGVDPPTVTVHLKKKPLPKKLPDGNGATKEPS